MALSKGAHSQFCEHSVAGTGCKICYALCVDCETLQHVVLLDNEGRCDVCKIAHSERMKEKGE